MPQAKHGGSGVCRFAAPISKFEGMGLENEQIEQIHVAVPGLWLLDPDAAVIHGLDAFGTGEAVPLRDGFLPIAGEPAAIVRFQS